MRTCIVLILSLAFTLVSYASEPGKSSGEIRESETGNNEKVRFSGYTRVSAWGGSKSYRLNTLFAEIALQGKYLEGKTRMDADVRVRKGTWLGTDYQVVEIRQLVAGYGGSKADVLVGYQNLAWGRTDGFNPTNYLQAYDYFYLTAEPDDQKKPNLTFRSRLRIGDAFEMDLALVPFYLPSVYRYDLFELGENVRFTDPLLPVAGIRNGSIAGRVSCDLPGLGFSVSAFRGYDPYHGFRLVSVDWTSGTPAIVNQAAGYRKTSLGADLSARTGILILKAEAAWNHTSRPNDEMHIPLSYWMYVTNIEAPIGSSTLIAGYIGHYTPDFTELAIPVLNDPLNPQSQAAYANAMIESGNRQFNRRIFHQSAKSNHALALTWFRRFAYDAIELRLTAFYDLTSREWMTRPTLKWSLNDQISLTAGVHYMNGNDNSLFSYAASLMNGGFIQIKADF